MIQEVKERLAMEPHQVAPHVRERQLFEQLTKLRDEQTKLRAHAAAAGLDAKGVERMRQIDVEATAAWNGIRSVRAAGRAGRRTRADF